MSAIFTQNDWSRIKEDSGKWWEGNLGRPLIQIRLEGQMPDIPKPQYPFYEFTSFYDFDVSPDQIVDSWEYQLLSTKHLGDAFPSVRPNFGPGSIAAYMGSELENGKDTVWFHPQKDAEIEDLEFSYIEDNKWFLRTKDILRAAVERWKGEVQIGLTDLGGNMDILALFRPSEDMMYDLYDEPEKVKELTWRAHELWWRYFEEFNEITSCNPGYSDWANIFYNKPGYILQCDFCYMIGPDMFDQFVQPELKATSGKMSSAFYHMDGIGQLNHLDKFLEMDSIKGIQWVPGAGQPDITHWPEVMKKITDAGKKIHICSNMADDPFTVLDKIGEQTGRTDQIVYCLNGKMEDEGKVAKLLDQYGIV